MKMMKMNLWFVAALCGFAACTDDDDDVKGKLNNPADTSLASVRFEMNANPLNRPLVTRAAKNTFDKTDFRIMAFKQNSGTNDFKYLKDVDMDNMSVKNNKLSGTAVLPIGVYKFVPSVGLSGNPDFSLDALTEGNTLLNGNLSITHNMTLTDTHPFFLEKRSFNELPAYSLGLTNESNPLVTATLNRAVSRVDVLFIRALKNPDNTYTEIPGGVDIFGGMLPQSFIMKFAGLNQKVNLVGTPLLANGTLTTFNADYSLDPTQAATIGTGEKTLVGNDDYTEYDNIQPADINGGSAHVRGALVLPFSDAATKAGLTLVITKEPGTVRTIAIKEGIPVERNKVTLVKIYVLSGTIFDTTVNFEVQIETAWNGINVVNEEVG